MFGAQDFHTGNEIEKNINVPMEYLHREHLTLVYSADKKPYVAG